MTVFLANFSKHRRKLPALNTWTPSEGSELTVRGGGICNCWVNFGSCPPLMTHELPSRCPCLPKFIIAEERGKRRQTSSLYLMVPNLLLNVMLRVSSVHPITYQLQGWAKEWALGLYELAPHGQRESGSRIHTT